MSLGCPFLPGVWGLAVLTYVQSVVIGPLVWFFRRDWVRIITGLGRSIRDRRITGQDARLGWLIILATIPVGLVGLVFEHQLRTVFAKPLAAAGGHGPIGDTIGDAAHFEAHFDDRPGGDDNARISALPTREAVGIGSFQIAALFAGISRSGIAMVGGLLRGLSHEDGARFSFMLATPVILAAGVYKIPDLFDPNGNGIHWQVIVGSIVAGLAGYVSVRFRVRWFTTRTLTPFAVYCLIAGAASILRFSIG